MESCIFCKIINGEIPSYKIYEDEHVFVILDMNPVTAGHFLVLPKKHFEMPESTDDEIISKMIIIAKRIAKNIKRILNSDGFNITTNSGEAAGQTISHTHFHVVQRFKNDNLKLWPPNENEKNKIKETYKKIISNI